MPDSTTFAEAPISVPLPPRHAPSDSAHHSEETSMPSACMDRMSGIMVATNGMLSRKDENSAEPHRMRSIISLVLPPVMATSPLPSAVITPVSTMPPTTTNRPVKNRMVDHSCLPMSSMMTALASAITHDSTPSEAWNTKPSTTRPIITRLFTSSALSLMDRFSSSCMTASMRSGSTDSLRPYRK